jgi:hydrogenase-4 component E
MALIEYNLAALVLLCTFLLLITRRIRGTVNSYAAQSILLGVIFICLFIQTGLLHMVLLAASAIVIKGVIIPIVLRRQVRDTVYGKREASYYVRFPTALLLAAVLSVVGFVAAARLPVQRIELGQGTLGVAMAVVLLGFFSTVARKEAAMQLTGLLVVENGLLLLGVVIGAGLPLLVDFALFLDVLVGAVVMGFLIARMHETVQSTDTSELTRLRG